MTGEDGGDVEVAPDVKLSFQTRQSPNIKTCV